MFSIFLVSGGVQVGFSLRRANRYRRPPAFFWAFFSRRGRRCLFFGRNLPFFLDAPGGGASCVAPASEACSSATESVAFAALALIFCLALGASCILFSGAVELQSSHFFKITSRGLRVERRTARTRKSASTNKNVFAVPGVSLLRLRLRCNVVRNILVVVRADHFHDVVLLPLCRQSNGPGFGEIDRIVVGSGPCK
jgi:hypothetical protein